MRSRLREPAPAAGDPWLPGLGTCNTPQRVRRMQESDP